MYGCTACVEPITQVSLGQKNMEKTQSPRLACYNEGE